MSKHDATKGLLTSSSYISLLKVFKILVKIIILNRSSGGHYFYHDIFIYFPYYNCKNYALVLTTIVLYYIICNIMYNGNYFHFCGQKVHFMIWPDEKIQYWIPQINPKIIFVQFDYSVWPTKEVLMIQREKSNWYFLSFSWAYLKYNALWLEICICLIAAIKLLLWLIDMGQSELHLHLCLNGLIYWLLNNIDIYKMASFTQYEILMLR